MDMLKLCSSKLSRKNMNEVAKSFNIQRDKPSRYGARNILKFSQLGHFELTL